jgi:hypothetical protein
MQFIKRFLGLLISLTAYCFSICVKKGKNLWIFGGWKGKNGNGKLDGRFSH